MAAATTLPPIETKFSFTGLQDAAAALAKIQSNTGTVFSQIKKNADANLSAVQRQVEKLGGTPLKKLGDTGNLKKASSDADGFFKKLTAPRSISDRLGAVRSDFSKIGLALKPLQLGASAASRSVGVLRDTIGATVRGAVGLGKVTIGAGISGAGTVLKAGGIAGGLGPAALGAGLGAASKSTADFVQQQQKLALASGTNLGLFQALSAAARKFGAEDDDLKGALSQLTDQLSQAAKGSGNFQIFQALGIPTTDQFGRLRDSGKVLLDLIDKTKLLNSSQRAGIFNQLLGGDAQKLSLLLASDRPTLAGIADQQDAAGVSITPQQIQLSNAYNASIFQLREALRGLTLDIGTRFLPVFTDSANKLSALIIKNRTAIGTYIADSYNKLVSIANDVIKIFKGQDDYVQHTWLLSVRDRLAVVKTWFADAIVFTKEFYDTVVGNDAAVTQFPWLITLRDGVISTFTQLAAFVPVALSAVKNAVEGAFTAARDLYTLITQGQSGAGSVTSPIISRFATDILYVRDLVIALVQTISGADVGDARFAFLVQIRADLLSFFADAQVVFGWFKSILLTFDSWVQPILKFFNVDLTQVVLFAGIARLITRFGLLGDAIKAVQLVWGGGKWLATAVGLIEGGGAVAGAAGAGGAIAAVTGLGASLAGLAIAIAPVVAAIAALAAAAYAGKVLVDGLIANSDAEESQKQQTEAAALRTQGDDFMNAHPEKQAQRARFLASQQQPTGQPLGDGFQVGEINRIGQFDQQQASVDNSVSDTIADKVSSRISGVRPPQDQAELLRQIVQMSRDVNQGASALPADFARLTPSADLLKSLTPTPQQIGETVNVNLTLPSGSSYPLQGSKTVVDQVVREIQQLQRRQLTSNPAWGQ